MGGNSGETQRRDVLKAGVGKISSPALQLKEEGSLPSCAGKKNVLFTRWLGKRNQIRTILDDFNTDFRGRSKSVQESSPVHLLRNVREFFQAPKQKHTGSESLYTCPSRSEVSIL